MGNAALIVKGLLAASAAVAIDIPETPMWDAGSCTDKSLTIPSWIISNYTVSEGVTSFSADSRVRESGSHIECHGDGICSGNAAGTVRASLDSSSGSPVVSLAESWVCSDAGEQVVFSAEGNATITQCSGNCESPIPYLVQGTLTFPIPLTPVQPKPPHGYDVPSCAKVGGNQWTVTDVSYTNYTVSQCKQWYSVDKICIDPIQFTSKGTYLNLTVTNNVIDYDVACTYAPTYGSYSLPNTLRCTGGGFNEITLDVSWTGAAPDFRLKIEELWYCLENPKTNTDPTAIVASGSTPINLDCKQSKGITGAADDIITTCSDPAKSHSVDGIQTAKKTLPSFSLDTASPVHGGCTFDSVVNPTYYMRGMDFGANNYSTSDPDKATLDSLSCGLTGPGFADQWLYETDPISGSGVNTLYNCNYLDDARPQHFDCTFKFNSSTKVLELDKVWQCKDKDETRPLYFDGSGNFDWNADSDYSCTTTDTHLACRWNGDLAILQPGVPYRIPDIKVSLSSGSSAEVKTVRTNGKWALASGGQ